MNFSAIMHRTNYEFVIPLTRTELAIRLRCAKDDLTSVRFVYFSRYRSPSTALTQPLQIAYRDAYTDDYRAILKFDSPARFLCYYFELTDQDHRKIYLSEYGFSDGVPEDGFFEYQYTNENDCVRPPDWAKGIVYYQIFPDRFYWSLNQKNRDDYRDWDEKPSLDDYWGGDLPGITERLPWISALGVDCIYLNPIFHAECNHKYATTDYFTIDPDFGTMADFHAFVAKAHSFGIRVVLDGVFNHSSRKFHPFMDFLARREASEYFRWFLPVDRGEGGEILTYEAFADRAHMPKLNTDYRPVRDFVIEVMLFWLREGKIDGWRLDVADEVQLTTWSEVRRAVKAEFPEAILIAETWRDASRYLTQGDKFDTAMNYAFREAARDFFANRRIGAAAFSSRINHMLSSYADVTNQVMFNLLDSHDTPRFLYDAGNDRRRHRLAVGFQMTFVGSPSIFYGDEVGLSGGPDPDCRRGMIWDASRQDQETLVLYKKLIALRKCEPALRFGSFKTVFTQEPGVFVYQRDFENVSILCAVNNSDAEAAISPPESLRKGILHDLMTGEDIETPSLSSKIPIAPMTLRILK